MGCMCGTTVRRLYIYKVEHRHIHARGSGRVGECVVWESGRVGSSHPPPRLRATPCVAGATPHTPPPPAAWRHAWLRSWCWICSSYCTPCPCRLTCTRRKKPPSAQGWVALRADVRSGATQSLRPPVPPSTYCTALHRAGPAAPRTPRNARRSSGRWRWSVNPGTGRVAYGFSWHACVRSTLGTCIPPSVHPRSSPTSACPLPPKSGPFHNLPLGRAPHGTNGRQCTPG